jgi:hypothetical protein
MLSLCRVYDEPLLDFRVIFLFELHIGHHEQALLIKHVLTFFIYIHCEVAKIETVWLKKIRSRFNFCLIWSYAQFHSMLNLRPILKAPVRYLPLQGPILHQFTVTLLNGHHLPHHHYTRGLIKLCASYFFSNYTMHRDTHNARKLIPMNMRTQTLPLGASSKTVPANPQD